MKIKEENMNTEIKLDKVIISYPSLFKQRSMDNVTNLKYDATFILNKNTHADEIKLIHETISYLCSTKNKTANKLTKNCFKDGDALKDRMGNPKEVPEYANSYIIAAKNVDRPVIVNKDGTTPISAGDGLLITGGALVLSYVKLFIYETKIDLGISAILQGVQLLDASTTFGAATFDPTNKFAPVDVADVKTMFG